MNESSSLPALVASAMVAVLSGCGGTDSPAPDDMGAGGGGRGGAQAVAGAASGSGNTGGKAAGGSGGSASAGSSGQAGAQASSDHTGQMVLITRLLQSQTSLTASFIEKQEGDSGCTSMQDGPCTLSLCPTNPPVTRTWASAGTLTVTSPEIAGAITQVPGPDGQYSMVAASTLASRFLGGESAVFSASGAAVPAFEQSLQSPLVLLLSSPLYAEGAAAVAVERSRDLALTWTRGAADVVLYLTGGGDRVDGEEGFANLTCQFPSAAGNAVVDASLLGQLAANTRLDVYTAQIQHVEVGDYDVTLGFVTGVANPDKKIIPGIDLQ